MAQLMAAIQPWLCWIMGSINQWQTLLAGLLALAGAWWTVRAIRAQIAQTAQLEKVRNEREERAARAVLPMALSELSQYSVDCIKLLEPHVPSSGASPEIPPDKTVPRIPEAILKPMQSCARCADPIVADQIQQMLGWLQIQHARLEGLIQRARQRSPQEIWIAEGVGSIMDAAELHARCSDLFHYARGSTPDPNQTFEQKLHNALLLAGIVGIDHPALAAAIRERPAPHTFS